MSVGMPAELMLVEFGQIVLDAFDGAVSTAMPYHVGSSLLKKRGWRDVDVRLILSDEEYERLGFGHPDNPHSARSGSHSSRRSRCSDGR
jgi:hypothetical protein